MTHATRFGDPQRGPQETCSQKRGKRRVPNPIRREDYCVRQYRPEPAGSAANSYAGDAFADVKNGTHAATENTNVQGSSYEEGTNRLHSKI